MPCLNFAASKSSGRAKDSLVGRRCYIINSWLLNLHKNNCLNFFMVHTPAVFQPSYIYSHVTRYITFFNIPSPFTFHFHSICPSVHLFCSPQHFPQIPFALAQKVPVPLLFHRPLDCPSDLTFELFQVVPKLFGGINVGR